jgi:hypothetical protein
VDHFLDFGCAEMDNGAASSSSSLQESSSSEPPPKKKARASSKKKKAATPWHDPTRDGLGNQDLCDAFLFELSQSLKDHYLAHDYFGRKVKFTFSRNYSEHIPLLHLHLLAVDSFAPPLQRLHSYIRQGLSDFPKDIRVYITSFLMPKALESAFYDIPKICSRSFLGPPEVTRSGELKIGLCKSHWGVGAKAPSSIINVYDRGFFGVWSDGSWWQGFVSQRNRPENAHRPWLGQRIIEAEGRVTPVQARRTLGLSTQPLFEEPHSIELAIKESSWGGAKKLLGTIVVPFDASIADLAKEVVSEFFYEARKHHQSEESSDDEICLNYGWTGVDIENSRAKEIKDLHFAGLPGGARWDRLPPSVSVRVSRIEMNDSERYHYDDYPYDDDDDDDQDMAASTKCGYTRCKYLGGLRKLVEKVEANDENLEHELESRVPYEESKVKLFAEERLKRPSCGKPNSELSEHETLDIWKTVKDRLRFEHFEHDDVDDRNTLSMDKGYLEIVTHVAIADLLPTFEQLHPSMQEFLDGETLYHDDEQPTITVDGSKSHQRFHFTVLRRSAFLDDTEAYPVIKKMAAGTTLPRYYF